MRTSIRLALRLLGAAGAAGLALLAFLRLLADETPEEEAVHHEGQRDVEAEHRHADDDDLNRVLAHQGEDSGEQDGGNSALLQGIRPARRLRGLRAALALLLIRAAARSVLCLAATARAAARRAGVDPAALGAAMLAAALLLRLGHRKGRLAENVLDHVTLGVEVADRGLVGIALDRHLRHETHQLRLDRPDAVIGREPVELLDHPGQW